MVDFFPFLRFYSAINIKSGDLFLYIIFKDIIVNETNLKDFQFKEAMYQMEAASYGVDFSPIEVSLFLHIKFSTNSNSLLHSFPLKLFNKSKQHHPINNHNQNPFILLQSQQIISTTMMTTLKKLKRKKLKIKNFRI